VMRGGSLPSTDGDTGGRVTALAHGASRVSDAVEGAVALKQEVNHDLSPAERLNWSKAGAAAAAAPSKAERRAEAKAK
ncbi:hypothetical protein ABTJ92_22855, partial [Acinetobacter baumannii]